LTIFNNISDGLYNYAVTNKYIERDLKEISNDIFMNGMRYSMRRSLSYLNKMTLVDDIAKGINYLERPNRKDYLDNYYNLRKRLKIFILLLHLSGISGMNYKKYEKNIYDYFYA
jgi:hypothetical protein